MIQPIFDSYKDKGLDIMSLFTMLSLGGPLKDKE